MPPPEPHVSYCRIPASLDRAQIEIFAETLRVQLSKGRPFHVLVTTDAELQRLNARFLGHDYATDVLSFPESRDIAISYPRARAQARQFGHHVEDEVRILMMHGLLHLCGRMARAEMRWRKKLGLPSSLIARAAA